MNNQINFTGIQNIGAMGQLAVDFRNLRPLNRKYLVAQMTNDYFGKDYDKYREAVNSCKDVIGENSFPLDKRFIHIITEKPLKHDEILPKLFLNLREIPVCDKTLKLYTFLAKFTRTLAHMKPEQYKIAQDFKYGPDGDSFIYGDSCISEFCNNDEKLKYVIDSIYNPHSVSGISQLINNDIQAKMMDYLC